MNELKSFKNGVLIGQWLLCWVFIPILYVFKKLSKNLYFWFKAGNLSDSPRSGKSGAKWWRGFLTLLCSSTSAAFTTWCLLSDIVLDFDVFSFPGSCIHWGIYSTDLNPLPIGYSGWYQVALSIQELASQSGVSPAQPSPLDVIWYEPDLAGRRC